MTIKRTSSLLTLAVMFILTAFSVQAQKLRPNTPPILQTFGSYGAAEYAADHAAYDAAVASGNYEGARMVRNDIAAKGRASVGLTYGSFESNLLEGRARWNVALDVIESGITSLISITGRAGLSTALAFVKGGRGSIDKNFFQAQTTGILINQMRAARLRIETRMDESQDLSVQDYALGRVQDDLAALFNAGTLPGGLMEASSQAGQSFEAAKQAATASRAVRINAAQQQRRLDQMLNGPATAPRKP